MTALELLKKYNSGERNFILYDIRDQASWDYYHIPFSIHVNPQLIFNDPNKYIPNDKDVYIICASGSASGFVSMILTTRGKFTNVYNVEKGINPLLEEIGGQKQACPMD